MGHVVGSLTGPCFGGNAGVGDILEGQLFAYGVASSVSVVDIPRLQTACVLHGGHGRAPVTAISWNPECHSRDLKAAGHLRLASGDREGNVVVWDVLRVAVVCKLGNPKSELEESTGVKSLCWILSDPCLMVVIVGPATLIAWDIQSGVKIWQKDLSGVGTLHSLSVDSLDRRCVCASSDTGVCVIAQFDDVMKQRVQVKQYRVTSRAAEPSGKNAINVHCIFPAPRDLLLVMLSREIILFDIEFGQPVNSFRLPLTHRPFLRILSTSGQGVSAGGGIEGGIDVIHCLHEDGKVTAWSRAPGKLSYTCTSTFDLVPHPIRTPNGATAKTSIVTAASAIWRPIGVSNVGDGLSQSPPQNDDGSSENTPTIPPHPLLLPDPALLVLTIMNNAQIWQWNLPLAASSPPSAEQLETPLNSAKSDVYGVKFVDASEADRQGEMESGDGGKSGGLEVNLMATPKEQGAPSPAPSAVSSFRCSSCTGGPTLLRVLTTLPSAVTTLAILPKPLLRSTLPTSKTPGKESTGESEESPPPEEASQSIPETDMEASQTSGSAVATLGTDMEASQSSGPQLVAENSGVSSDLDLCGTSPFKLAIDTNQDFPSMFDLMSQKGPSAGRHESLQEEIETSTSTPVMAVVTSSGTLEIVPVNRGCVTAISLEITRSFALHNERSRSVRWLGCSPLVVSFCTERTQHGWKNSLLVMDVRTGESAPFRELGSENAAMIGIRTSPSGRYILIVMKESPAEIWMVSGLRHVRRARHVDIAFTAVEWAVPEGPPFDPISLEYWQQWGCGEEWEEGVCVTDFPPETFVFAAKDGKVGAFTIKGKKVMDYKIRKAMWGVLSGGNSNGTKCSAVAALGSLVMFGDVEGNLTQWDMASNKSTTVATECGAIRKILMTPVRSSIVRVRLAIHSASWRCSIWELDNNGVLTQTNFNSPNRFPDISWIPNPTSTPYTTLLATVGEEGSLAVLDIDNAGALPPDGQSTPPGSPEITHPMSMDGVLGGEPWLSSSLLLPNPLRLLLRLILQVGTPVSVLNHAVGLDTSVSDEEMEKEIWNRLPGNLNALSWGQPRAPPPTTGRSGLAPLMEEPSLRGGAREDMEVSGEWVSVSDKGSIPSCGFETERPPPTRLDVSMMRKSRNLSLASEVLASYAAAESRKKNILRKMKVAVFKVKSKRAPSSNAIPQQQPQAEWGEASADVDDSSMLPSSECLLDVIRAIAVLRAKGKLLMPEEWTSYQRALEASSTACRMAVAAQVSGDWEEVEFWRHLPETLAEVRRRAKRNHDWKTEEEDDDVPLSETARGGCCLWTESMAISTSTERVRWHENLPRSNIESHPELQDRRLLEYVCLGDYNTAVGFLLASAPEASIRYYRDSLCALALAAAHQTSSGEVEPTGSLHLQVAKVVSAHAASVSDPLLGVPLLCSAGLPNSAVSLLQDSGLWRYAATLTAARLEGPDHALSCLRWAQHVLVAEGSVWRSVGILASGGCLKQAAQVLKDAGLADCAAAFCECCTEAGLVSIAPSDVDQEESSTRPSSQQRSPGKLGQLFEALSSTQFARINPRRTDGRRRKGPSDDSQQDIMNNIVSDFESYVGDLVSIF